jgi:predicted NBD/HSP70 family sugar kinase
MSAQQPPILGIEPNPGSQTALRLRNQHRVLDTLTGSGPLTQTELARQTGLSTATISNIVKTMTAAGTLETEPTTSSGRRASLVRLSSGGQVAVGIHFGPDQARVLITTPSHEVLAEATVGLEPGYRAVDAIGSAAKLLNRLLVADGIPRSAVIGVGVGVPAPIDRRSGAAVRATILPEWVGILPADFEVRLQLPVLLANDANLAALAEMTRGAHSAIADLVNVVVGSGIGAGLIVNGQPCYGASGLAGAIGHEQVGNGAIPCYCGKRGCLETVASTTAMIRVLARRRTPISTADIVASAINGDAKTLRVLDDAGLAIGCVLARAANLINPEVIVVGGPLAGLGEILLAPIRRGLLRYATDAAGESAVLVMSDLGDRAGALGAAALVLSQHGIRNL